MEYQPPISTRATQKLLEIIESPEDWEPIAVEQARTELESRGVGRGEQKNREKSFKKFTRKYLFIKGNKSYSKIEFILLVVFSPVMLFFSALVPIDVDPDYRKKRNQAWLAFFLGLGLWLLVIYLIYK